MPVNDARAVGARKSPPRRARSTTSSVRHAKGVDMRVMSMLHEVFNIPPPRPIEQHARKLVQQAMAGLAGAGPLERNPPRSRSPRSVHDPAGTAAESAGMAPSPKRSRKGSLTGMATGASTVTTVLCIPEASSPAAVPGSASPRTAPASARGANADFILLRDRRFSMES